MRLTISCSPETKVGQRVRHSDIGKGGKGFDICVQCPDCLRKRWITAAHANHPEFSGVCRPCAAKRKIGEEYEGHARCIVCPPETEIGTRVRAYEIGRKGMAVHFCTECPVCGIKRWVSNINRPSFTSICQDCNLKSRIGEKNHNWKGGKRVSYGYIHIKLYPNDFFYPMAGKDSYVAEHRLIMAKHLNRCLLSWEIVHHKNGIRDDNRLENLELLPGQVKHRPSMEIQRQLSQQEKEIAQLRRMIIWLASLIGAGKPEPMKLKEGEGMERG